MKESSMNLLESKTKKIQDIKSKNVSKTLIKIPSMLKFLIRQKNKCYVSAN